MNDAAHELLRKFHVDLAEAEAEWLEKKHRLQLMTDDADHAITDEAYRFFCMRVKPIREAINRVMKQLADIEATAPLARVHAPDGEKCWCGQYHPTDKDIGIE